MAALRMTPHASDAMCDRVHSGLGQMSNGASENGRASSPELARAGGLGGQRAPPVRHTRHLRLLVRRSRPTARPCGFGGGQRSDGGSDNWPDPAAATGAAIARARERGHRHHSHPPRRLG
jgi:hypothetical protein